jgi:hypothetical protein
MTKKNRVKRSALDEPMALAREKAGPSGREARDNEVFTLPSNLMRQLRVVDIEPGVKILIRSGRDGQFVPIRLKVLNNYQKDTLCKALDVIEERLKGSEWEKSISLLSKATAFCVTSTRHLNAYSGKWKEKEPLVVLNGKTFSMSSEEFAVTILHELMHFMHEWDDDRNPQSEFEAEHDFLCYFLLGIPIPGSHWAWKVYPHLKEKMYRRESSVVDEMIAKFKNPA